MKGRKLAVYLAAAVGVAAVTVGGAAYANHVRSANDARSSASSTDVVHISPEPLTPEMIETAAKNGNQLIVDDTGTKAQPAQADAASVVALQSFNWLDANTNKFSASLATVTVESEKGITARRLWVIYIENVHQPSFGGDFDNGVGTLVVLVDPETMKYVHANSF